MLRRRSLLLCFWLSVAGFACGGEAPKQLCESNSECLQSDVECTDTCGYVCDLAKTKKCLRRCKTNNHCLASQTCDIPENANPPGEGVCRSTAPTTP